VCQPGGDACEFELTVPSSEHFWNSSTLNISESCTVDLDIVSWTGKLVDDGAPLADRAGDVTPTLTAPSSDGARVPRAYLYTGPRPDSSCRPVVRGLSRVTPESDVAYTGTRPPPDIDLRAAPRERARSSEADARVRAMAGALRARCPC
jgi:hypothetical protein